MQEFGLPDRTLKTMRAIFARYPQIEKVVVYGSRAMGNYRTGSDIDLTMYGEYTDSITYNDLNKIAGELDDSDIPYMVDLSIFDALDHANLQDHIERVGKVFYERIAMQWEKKRLEDLCIFVRGLTYSKKDEVQESSNRVLRATNIDLETHTLKFDDIRFINDEINIKEEKQVKQNDILIYTASGSKSHLGKVAFINNTIDFAFGGFMAVIRTNDEILPQYLFNILISQDFKNHLSQLSDGANINNLKFDLIKDFLIPLPPLPVQKQIVEKLDAAFADIDRAMNATKKKTVNLIALKSSILNHAFSGELTKDKA